MVDVTKALEPRSDQLNADDALAGPITIHVTGAGISAEGQLVITTSEYPQRPWHVSKGMGRFIAAIWGAESELWVGQTLTLYRDPDVKYAGQAVGGLRIEAMTGLHKPFTGPLRITRGKSVPFTIQPLTSPASTASQLTDAEISACTDVEALRAMWPRASTVQQAQITARANQLTGKEKTND